MRADRAAGDARYSGQVARDGHVTDQFGIGHSDGLFDPRVRMARTDLRWHSRAPTPKQEKAPMSGEAVIMLIVAVIIVWGGLAASVIQLRRHPDKSSDPDA